jgi:A/G-specific adenine glycosylase
VLSRVFGIDKEINSPEGRKIFSELANELISRKHPDRYNQAIMEFGALFCTPKNPDCPACIFKTTCFAAQHNLQAVLPVKAKAKAARKRYFYYFVFQQGKSLLMKKRGAKDIWQGLYDFYLVEKSKPMKTEKVIREFNTSGPWVVGEDGEASAEYKHVLSHQIILSKFILVRMDAKPLTVPSDDLKFYSLKKIADLPKPVLISRFLADRDLLK